MNTSTRYANGAFADQLLDTRKAAAWLDKAEGTLRNERYRKVGPPFVKLSGGAIRYRLSDLQKFANDRVVNFD